MENGLYLFCIPLQGQVRTPGTGSRLAWLYLTLRLSNWKENAYITTIQHVFNCRNGRELLCWPESSRGCAGLSFPYSYLSLDCVWEL